MFFESAYDVLDKIKNNNIVIVGAGKAGRELAEFLFFNGISLTAFFDNNTRLIGKSLFNIPIKGIEIIKDCKYIISVGEKYRKELLHELKTKNIADENIFIYYPTPHDEEYILNKGQNGLEMAISALFRNTFGYDMNWDNPISYNEKIQWEKARVQDNNRTLCADKFRVRQFIAEQIGEKYLTHLYGDWERVEDICFDNLPSKFVIKLNNGSARNIIVRDKTKIDREQICKKLKQWMSVNWAYTTFEMHYRDIVPHIYCEELLEGVETEDFCDYKVFCFDGKVKYIQRIRFEHTDKAVGLFYDRDWTRQPFNQYYADDEEVEKPSFLPEIISNSEKLSKSFKHVRIDWFVNSDFKIYFGEMTFANWSGLEKFRPEEYDRIFGELI